MNLLSVGTDEIVAQNDVPPESSLGITKKGIYSSALSSL